MATDPPKGVRYQMKNQHGDSCGHMHRTPELATWCPIQPDDSEPEPWPIRIGAWPSKHQ